MYTLCIFTFTFICTDPYLEDGGRLASHPALVTHRLDFVQVVSLFSASGVLMARERAVPVIAGTSSLQNVQLQRLQLTSSKYLSILDGSIYLMGCRNSTG